MSYYKHYISIITVVKNGENEIKDTIESVINQTYSNFEFIVIDGLSIDNTEQIIENYKKNIDILIIENDKGIYDAMNKGLSLANGEWVIFINSGDKFSNCNILSKANEKLNKNAAIVYGNYKVSYRNKIKKRKSKLFNFLNIDMPTTHQSIFMNMNFYPNFFFNLQYKIASDFSLLCIAKKNRYIVEKINLDVSTISSGGISDVNRLNSIKETELIYNEILKKNIYSILFFKVKIVKCYFSSLIKKIINQR